MSFHGQIPLWDRSSRKANFWNRAVIRDTDVHRSKWVVWETEEEVFEAFGRPLLSGTYPGEYEGEISHADLSKDYEDPSLLSPEDRWAIRLGLQQHSTRGMIRLKTGETLFQLAKEAALRQTTAEFERFFKEVEKKPNLKGIDVMKDK